MRLDARARQDIAFLGTEFLKLDGKSSSAVPFALSMMNKNKHNEFFTSLFSRVVIY